MKANTKDWIQYSTAMAMVASAIVLAFLSFIIINTVPGGVLLYISEALVYAAGIFGVSIYFRSKLGEFESRQRKEIDADIEKKLDERLKNQ